MYVCHVLVIPDGSGHFGSKGRTGVAVFGAGRNSRVKKNEAARRDEGKQSHQKETQADTIDRKIESTFRTIFLN